MIFIFLLFTHKKHALWKAELGTEDQTGVLPHASIKSQLVMQQKKHKIKQAHALLLLMTTEVFLKTPCVNSSFPESQKLKRWVCEGVPS